MHLWYDAPHGPWELIEEFAAKYNPSKWGGKRTRNYKYVREGKRRVHGIAVIVEGVRIFVSGRSADN